MNLAVTRTAITILGIICAVIIGNMIGSGAIILPALLAIGCVYWLISQWLDIPLETGIVACLVLGYIIANRGFAQITPPGLPIFLGELGLAACGILMLARIPLLKDIPIKLNSMGVLIILWMVTCAFHLLFDLRNWGILALRDFAMVYYALFFFVGQFIAQNNHAKKLILNCLVAALGIMPILFILFLKFESFFLQTLTYNNNPIIYYKGDLVGILGVTAHLYFFCLFILRKNFFYLIPSLVGLSAVVVTSARVAFVCFALGALMLVAARVKYYLRFIAISATVGLGCLTLVGIADDEPFHTSKVYGLYEHFISIVDFEGKLNYKNPDSVNTGDNNRYRLVWWEVLVQQTLTHAPMTGFGFGYNLANPFLEAYYVLPDENFSVRSPHNFLLTVFGRTGLIGIAFISAILLCKAQDTLKLINDARKSKAPSMELTLHIMTWSIFIGACFGVVLEGPMGAIPFWLLLGMAQSPQPQESTQAAYNDTSILTPEIIR